MAGRKNIPVRLTDWEASMAAHVGMRRELTGLLRGLTHKYGKTGRGWEEHIEGAAGELAVARVLERYWDGYVSPNASKHRPDIAPNIEVRTYIPKPTHKQPGRLIIREDDPDDRLYVLAVGHIPEFVVVGWIKGSDAKRQGWDEDPNERGAAWWVPQDALEGFPLQWS